MIESLRDHAQSAGRDPAEIEISMGCVLDILDDAGPGTPRPHRDLIGTPSAIADHVHQLEALGITHLALDFRGATPLDGMLETLDRFDRLVRPLL